MSKVITFKVPVEVRHGRDRYRKVRDMRIEERRGRPLWLEIAGKRYRFVLQYDDRGRAKSLTHWASGMRCGSLDDAKVRAMLARGHHCQITDRMAAEDIMGRAVSRMGAAEVCAQLDTAPVLNVA